VKIGEKGCLLSLDYSLTDTGKAWQENSKTLVNLAPNGPLRRWQKTNLSREIVGSFHFYRNMYWQVIEVAKHKKRETL
jgi:hypothetical protein